MSEQIPALPPIDLTEVREVENQLGLRILRDGQHFMPDHATDEELRSDIRRVLFAAGSLALRQGAEAQDIARDELLQPIRWLQSQVDVANNLAAANFGHIPRDPHRDRRGHFQGRIMHGINHHAQTVPTTYLLAAERGEAFRVRDNLLVVAPTGTGKTVLEAKFLHDAGVGNGTKALVIVPDQALHRQYRGDTGDNTFRRWLGEDVEISSYWQYDKQSGGPLQIVTKQSIQSAIDNNALDIRSRDLVIVDEGHVGLEAKLMEYLNRFGRVYYYTATPAYDMKRDLRTLFRHVEVGTLTDCIYEGIINDVELYTFRVENQEEAERLAARLAYSDVQEGRKVVAYCQSGAQARQAQVVAEQINQLHTKAKGASQQDAIAQRVSGYDDNALDVVKAYEEGAIRALTTVGMLGQGYNGDIDTAILIGKKTSMLQLVQRIGRALRPSDQYRSRLIEILYDHGETLTIWNALGLDEVEQGLILGPERETTAQFDMRSEAPLYETMPEDIKRALIPPQPVGKIALSTSAYEALIAYEQGYLSAPLLARQYKVTVRRIHAALDKQGYRYAGVWTPDEDGTNKYERWYEPEAKVFLAENPLPPDWNEGEHTIYGVMELCGVSKDAVLGLVGRLNITPQERNGKNNRSAEYYTEQDVQRIVEAVAAIPYADESDVTTGTLRLELGEKFFLRCMRDPETFGEPIYKRRHPASGFKGFDLHVTKEQADKIRRAFQDAMATDDDISYLEIAALAGVTPATINHGVTPEEKAMSTLKRATPTSRHGYHLPREAGLKVAERFMVHPLPTHLVPFKMLAERVNTGAANVRRILKQEMKKPDSRVQLINLGGSNFPAACVPWAFLQELEEKYGLREGVEAIDYENIPHDKNCTLDQWEYSTHLKKSHIEMSKLAVAPQDTWRSHMVLTGELRCTSAALSILAVMAGMNEKKDVLWRNGTSYLSSELARKISIVRNGHAYTNHEDWIAASVLFASTKYTRAELTQKIRAIAPGSHERRLGLDRTGVLDVCYARPYVDRIVRQIDRDRARKSMPSDEDAD